MKKFVIHIISVLVTIVTFTSCEIVQEVKFEENGSGTYSLGFDMSEMMKMGANRPSEKEEYKKQIDTLIDFEEYIIEKKDSIQKLSKEEQKKIENLKDFKLYLKSDTLTNQLVMKIAYDFKNVEDIKDFSKKLGNQNIKELQLFTKQIQGNQGQQKSPLPDFNEVFETKFSKTTFSSKITQKSLEDAQKKKDTTMTKDNPMANLIRFKQRFVFPYKIKKVSNENVRILPDFKGVEIEANMYEMNNNPKFFDIAIEFENE